MRVFSSCAKAGAVLLASSALMLAGCAGSLTSTPTAPSAIAVSGNWQIASSATAAAALPSLSGTLTGSSTSIHGILHSGSKSACVQPTSSFAVTGAADANNLVTLTGPVAGGTLTVTGTLAADGKSLTNAGYVVTGGTCAFATAHAANATVQQYADITGTYNGTFYDQDSATTPVLTMTAQLTQSPAGDTNGDFTLTGQVTQYSASPCFVNPPTVASSQVTGGSFSITYVDSQTTNTVTANGTFTPDGKTLTITQWTLTGPCGPTFGNGTMVKQ